MSAFALKFSHAEQTDTIFNVAANQKALLNFMESQELDMLLITAQDNFLSEYNSLPNNQRYYLSGFTGSTGNGILLSPKIQQALKLPAPFLLFVDGRYHLQADNETDSKEVCVMKVDTEPSITPEMLKWAETNLPSQCKLALDGGRFAWNSFRKWKEFSRKKGHSLKTFLSDEVSAALALPGWNTTRDINPMDETLTGRSLTKNAKALRTTFPRNALIGGTCVVTCSSADVAWLTDARGYHLPRQASFLAYSFLISNNLVIFLPSCSSQCKVNLRELSELHPAYKITVIRGSGAELVKTLKKFVVTTILFDGASSNLTLPALAKEVWPNADRQDNFTGLEKLRVAKTPEELTSFRDSYLRSSRAIAKTLRWVKESVKLPAGSDSSDPDFKAPISEKDLQQKILKSYGEEGALELSFSTIAGTGANSAIVHYSRPSDSNKIVPGHITLLDSGAYYEAGFATDCTRVVFCNNGNVKPEAWQIEIYSLALKACVTGMRATFGKKTKCSEIDALVRNVCLEKGYDYSHGTGHGIGIHVHEEGIRLSKSSQYLFTKHAVTSIEPGIYLTGKGGVRMENVVIVQDDPTNSANFCFENIIFVGYDWDLIDLSYFNSDELEYLKNYEIKCLELGTQVTPCPLIQA